MAERMINTIKHGITVLATTPGSTDCWDDHLAKILFGYRCGVQTSTRFSPFMILTSRTLRLRADNYLHALTAETDVGEEVEVVAAQFLQKMELIASIHENVLLNVEQAQKQQRRTYASRRGKHLFEGLVAGVTMVKMKKPGKRRALSASWEGPYQFVGHVHYYILCLFAKGQTKNLKGLRSKNNLPYLRCNMHRNLCSTTHR
jgi:hypothetical protein